MKNISRYIAIIASILIIAAIFYFFSDIVGYVLIAWVLSMIGQPMMRFFQRKIKIGKFKAGSSTSAILTILCYFIIFTVLIWMFVPLVVQQAQNLRSIDYGQVEQALEVPLNYLNDQFASIGLVETGDSPSKELSNTLRTWFKPEKIGNFFSSLIGFAGNFVFGLFAVVFILFFFLKDQGLFVNFLVAITPSKYGDEVRNALDRITKLLRRYFGGILLQITIITIFISVLLGILGVKNALLIGFFAALINVIPYLGPLIGASFALFITISSNLGLDFTTELLPLLIKVLVVFGAMQMLDNFILQPYIFSNSVLAHPLEIFIIILMGAKINGIVGMVLAIPVYTVLRVIARSFLSEFKIVQKITKGMEEGMEGIEGANTS